MIAMRRPITSVQQNTGEVFAIVRKRLFDRLPPEDRIDEVAQAYADALQKAKRVDTVAPTPETFIERIREDAFVTKLATTDLDFTRAKAADTGRPGYDPRDLMKLYLYGYLNQIHSSRRLEAECWRNVDRRLKCAV